MCVWESNESPLFTRDSGFFFLLYLAWFWNSLRQSKAKMLMDRWEEKCNTVGHVGNIASLLLLLLVFLHTTRSITHTRSSHGSFYCYFCLFIYLFIFTWKKKNRRHYNECNVLFQWEKQFNGLRVVKFLPSTLHLFENHWFLLSCGHTSRGRGGQTSLSTTCAVSYETLI